MRLGCCVPQKRERDPVSDTDVRREVGNFWAVADKVVPDSAVAPPHPKWRVSILEKLRSDKLALRLQQETGLAPAGEAAGGKDGHAQAGAGGGRRGDGAQGGDSDGGDDSGDDTDTDTDSNDDHDDDAAAIFNAEELEELQSPKALRRGTTITAVGPADMDSPKAARQRGHKRSRGGPATDGGTRVLAVGNIVDSLQSMLVEVQSEYVRSVKRSIVEYKLLSPGQQGRLGVNVEALRRAYTPEVSCPGCCGAVVRHCMAEPATIRADESG